MIVSMEENVYVKTVNVQNSNANVLKENVLTIVNVLLEEIANARIVSAQSNVAAKKENVKKIVNAKMREHANVLIANVDQNNRRLVNARMEENALV